MVNCHFCIIQYLFKLYGIDDDFIDDYVQNKYEALKKYLILDKEVACSIIDNENISSRHHKIVKRFHKNIYGENGLLSKIEKDFKQKKNKLFEKIVKMVQKKENA